MRLSVAVVQSAVCLLLTHVTSAEAAHPFITDDTRTQGTGHFELQLGTQYTRTSIEDTVLSNFQFAPQLTYGVLEELDAIVRPTYNVNVFTGAQPYRASGFGDTNLEFKWRFWSAETLSAALRAGTGIASGNAARGLDSGQTTPRVYLLVTEALEPVEFDLNVGTVRNIDDPGARQWLGHVSLLALWKPRDDLQFGADLAIDQSPVRSPSQTPAVLLLGVIWKSAIGWDFDAGYQRGLNSSAPRNQYLLGATLRW